MKAAKNQGICNFIVTAALLLGCLYTLHDMQTAEGIGLFLSMQLGADSRLPFDLLVDVVCMGLLLLLVYLPCRLLRHRTRDCFLRLLIVYLAALPSVSLAELLGFFREGGLDFVWDRGPFGAWDCWVHLYSAVSFLQLWLPMLLLLYGFARISNCFWMEKRHRGLLIVMGILTVLLVILPSAENILVYWLGYLGIVLAFDIWESVFLKKAELKVWFSPLFGILLLRGSYNMLVLVSRY